MKFKIRFIWILLFISETLFSVQLEDALTLLTMQLQVLQKSLGQIIPVAPTAPTVPTLPTIPTTPTIATRPTAPTKDDFAEKLKKLSQEEKEDLFKKLEKELKDIYKNYDQEVKPNTVAAIKDKLENFFTLLQLPEFRSRTVAPQILGLRARLRQITPEQALAQQEASLLQLKNEFEADSQLYLKKVAEEIQRSMDQQEAKLYNLMNKPSGTEEQERAQKGYEDFLESKIPETYSANKMIISNLLGQVRGYEEDARKIGKPISPQLTLFKSRLFEELNKQLQEEATGFIATYNLYKTKYPKSIDQLTLRLMRRIEQYTRAASELVKPVAQQIQDLEAKVSQIREELKNSQFEELTKKIREEAARFDATYDAYKKNLPAAADQLVSRLIQTINQYRKIASELRKTIPQDIQDFEFKVLQIRDVPPFPTR